MRYQLQHFRIDFFNDPDLNRLSSIRELCQYLTKMKKWRFYYLVDRLIHLVLTLPVFTATTECTFSAIKFLKTRLCNKMEDEFLTDSLVIYIEREIVEAFSLDFILDEFVSLKKYRLQF